MMAVAQDAAAQDAVARDSGLDLFLSSTNKTGYRRVHRKAKAKSDKPFTAEDDDAYVLGNFATAVEAAVAYARYRAGLHLADKGDLEIRASNGAEGRDRRWLVCRGGSQHERC